MVVWATLLNEDVYVCSVSTMYHILAANKQVKERRRLARHRKAVCPELVASGPRQVYSLGHHQLRGPAKGIYYDAYVMIDIYSRYIVGVHVHARECVVLAKEMMEQIFGTYGIPARRARRPGYLDDQQHRFKAMKYAPAFPNRFESIHHARDFMDEFIGW